MAACKMAKKEPGFLPAFALLLVEAVKPRTHATGSGFPGSIGARTGRRLRVATMCLRFFKRQTTLDGTVSAFEVHPDDFVSGHFWFPL